MATNLAWIIDQALLGTSVIALLALFATQLYRDKQIGRTLRHPVTRVHVGGVSACCILLVRSIDPVGIHGIFSFRVLLLFTINSLAIVMLTAIFIITQTGKIAANITRQRKHFGPFVRGGYCSIAIQALVGNICVLVSVLTDSSSYVLMVTPFTSCIALVLIVCCAYYNKGVRSLREGIKRHALIIAGRGTIREDTRLQIPTPKSRPQLKAHKNSVSLPDIVIDRPDTAAMVVKVESPRAHQPTRKGKHSRARSRHMKLELTEEDHRNAMADIEANPVLFKVWRHLQVGYRTAMVLYAVGITAALGFATATVADTDRRAENPEPEDSFDISKGGYNWVQVACMVWYVWYLWNNGDQKGPRKSTQSGTHSHSGAGSKRGSQAASQSNGGRRSSCKSSEHLAPTDSRVRRLSSARRPSVNGVRRSGSFPRSDSAAASGANRPPTERSSTVEFMQVPKIPVIEDEEQQEEQPRKMSISFVDLDDNNAEVIPLQPEDRPARANLEVPASSTLPGSSSDVSVSDADSVANDASTDASTDAESV